MTTARTVRAHAAAATAATDLKQEPTVPLDALVRHFRLCGDPRSRRVVLADQFSVGDRFRGGAVSGGVRDNEVWINCALLGAGVTVDLSPAQAEVFAAHLTEWARRARG